MCKDEEQTPPKKNFQYLGEKMHMVIAQEACEEIKRQTCKIPYQKNSS